MAKLYFRYAAMNAGKSTQLLQIAHNYNSLGKQVLLMTAKIDGRFGVGRITSRLGGSRSAECFDAMTDLFREVEQFQQKAGTFRDFADDDPNLFVLIDEAQFLTAEQVRQLHRAVHQLDVPVLCFGLRSDFRGEPFEGSTMLLALAESIEEIKNVCECGRKATMNARFDEQGNREHSGPQVLIGDSSYKAVCASCFYTT